MRTRGQQAAAAGEVDLVRRACAGDDRALAQLVELYHDRVYRFGRRFCRAGDLDDAVQETFASLVAHRRRFRGEASIGTWLYVVVRNHCHRLLGSLPGSHRWLGPTSDDAGLAQLPDRRPGPEDVVQRREVVDLVHASLAALSPEHRQVLVLRDLYGRSGAETARWLGLSLPAMKSRLHRAREALRAEVAWRGTADEAGTGDRAAPELLGTDPRIQQERRTCQRLAEN